MTENNNIVSYIKTFPLVVQTILEKVRDTIHKSAPDAVEAFSYGVPTFKLKDKNVMLFAAFKKHIGIYPNPSAIKKYKRELTDYELSKGTIKFPIDKPLPYYLISKIVKFNVKQIEEK